MRSINGREIKKWYKDCDSMAKEWHGGKKETADKERDKFLLALSLLLDKSIDEVRAELWDPLDPFPVSSDPIREKFQKMLQMNRENKKLKSRPGRKHWEELLDLMHFTCGNCGRGWSSSGLHKKWNGKVFCPWCQARLVTKQEMKVAGPQVHGKELP
jgi:hypothetical protein